MCTSKVIKVQSCTRTLSTLWRGEKNHRHIFQYDVFSSVSCFIGFGNNTGQTLFMDGILVKEKIYIYILKTKFKLKKEWRKALPRHEHSFQWCNLNPALKSTNNSFPNDKRQYDNRKAAGLMQHASLLSVVSSWRQSVGAGCNYKLLPLSLHCSKQAIISSSWT